MTIEFLPLLKENGESIINMSSVGATHSVANLSMYVGAKAVVENFAKVWAIELAPYNIRVMV